MSLRKVPEGVRSWFAGELEIWRDAGILTPEQTGQIASLYESSEAVAARRGSWLVFILMGVASLLIALAALLLVGYNWEALPKFVKLAVVFGVILGLHGTGFYLKFARGKKFAAELAFFAGCLAYGIGIWQVAQIYHIESHYPNGIWIWAVGALPFALCLETPLLHALFVALMAIWAGTEMLGFGNVLFRWWLPPNGAYSLPFLVAPGLYWAYRKNSRVAVALYVPLLAWWLVLQPTTWGFHAELNIYFVGLCGALLVLVAQLHPNESKLAIPYRFFGVIIVGGVLTALSFYEFNKDIFGRSFGYYSSNANNIEKVFLQLLAATGVVVAAAVITTVSAALVASRRDGTANSFRNSIYSLISREWLPIALLAAMALVPIAALAASSLGETAVVVIPTIFGNVGMIALGLWLLWFGLHTDRGRPFAAGVSIILLWAACRYGDLFANLGGMLGAAAVFFLCGVALFAAALYWKKRKAISHE